MTVFATIARVVHVATGPFRPVALAGLVSGAALVLALLPWTLHATATVVLLVVVAALSLGAPLRLLQHRRRLRTTLGDETRVRAELAALRGQAVEAVERLHALDERRRATARAGERERVGVVGALRDLRALRRALDVGGAADRVRDLYAPVSPPALGLTGAAAAVIAAATVLAPVAVVVSVVGLLLR